MRLVLYSEILHTAIKLGKNFKHINGRSKQLYSRAGQVLVQPLSPTKPADVYFEYDMLSRTSQTESSQKKNKRLPISLSVWQCCVVLLLDSHSLYCDEACAAYSRFMQLS